MAIAFVQKSAQLFADNATTISPSLAGTTAGNLVVMLVNCVDAGVASPPPALSPPAGWLDAVSEVGPVGGDAFKPVTAIFYKENIAGGVESGTVNLPASSYAMATIVEFSGVSTSSSLDVVDSASFIGVTAGDSGTTAATAIADSVAIAVGCPQVGGGAATTGLSTPAAVGYTNLYAEVDGGGGHTVGSHDYKILSATGTQVASWTWNESAYFSGSIAVFSGTVAPASTGNSFVPLIRRRRR